MSKLRAILDRINDIEATIAQITAQSTVESAFADRLTLQSLESRRDKFREELAEITKQESIEVCDYRIIQSSGSSYALSAITSALHDFQDIFSIIFDAITTKPKQRFELSADIAEKTRLDFGFAYAGSLGVALTIPNERLLAIDSNLDSAMKVVFSLLEIQSPEAIKEAALRYGRPAVKKLYSWSKVHKDYGMSADIKWIREKETRSSVIAQPENFARICEIIETKNEPQIESITLIGVLDAWNATGRRFILRVPDAEPINGIFKKGFDATPSRTVHGTRYQANLLKYTTVIYTSDADQVYWELEGIKELE